MSDAAIPNSAAPETESQENTGVQEPQNDVTKLVSALEKERASRKELETRFKQQQAKEAELTATLEKYKAIDPEKYDKLIEAQRVQEENDLKRRKEYGVLEARLREETSTAQKTALEWQRKYEAEIIENSVKSAFYDCNGRKSSMDLSAEGLQDISPVQGILSILKPYLKMDDGRVVILDPIGNIETNKEGRPKTLTEKMMEIKRGSMGSLFEPDNTNAGSGMSPTTSYGGKSVKVYTVEQARTGKASIDDIASGKAIVN